MYQQQSLYETAVIRQNTFLLPKPTLRITLLSNVIIEQRPQLSNYIFKIPSAFTCKTILD